VLILLCCFRSDRTELSLLQVPVTAIVKYTVYIKEAFSSLLILLCCFRSERSVDSAIVAYHWHCQVNSVH
jgi:hypothetical protein